SKATLAKNYPVERGDGALEVFGHGYFQRFTTFHTKQVFVRRKLGGNWTDWVQSMTQLGGTFTGNVSAPNLSATGTLQSNYRLVIDRNEDAYPPYINIIDSSIDLDNNAKIKEFAHINFVATRAGTQKPKAKVVSRLADDKSADIRLVTTNDADRYTYNLTLFGQTGNVAVGKTTDNGVEKLQVAGTIGALGYINTTSTGWERLRATLADGSYWRWEVNPASATDPRFNYVYRSASGEQRYIAFPTLAKNETVAYQSWIASKLSDSVTSDSNNTVATSKAVKSANDNANGRIAKTGDIVSGNYTFSTGHIEIQRPEVPSGQFWGGLHLKHTAGGANTGLGITNYFNDVHLGVYGILDDGYKSRYELWLAQQGNNAFGAAEKAMQINSNGVIWTKSYGWLHDYFSKKGDVSVLTGIISHNGTLPLPAGFSESQCRWLVSMRDDNENGAEWDVNEGATVVHKRNFCYTNGRLVNAYTRIFNDRGNIYQDLPGNANYIVIGIR
ncbi:tail fiber protein, partial [Avibacterium volantium]|uniref:tail fiber protein n=1 Tax=Avibacterium TaxID=292486 RepID=UPI0039FD31D2